MGRRLPALFALPTLPPSPAAPPLPRDVWLPEIEVMVARDNAGVTEGFFVAAKGGHNAESHNHNDIGNFVIYIDGKPVLVDAGVETYTAKTFSEQRYEIWTMQSAYHSLLPTIEGVQQLPGAEYKATHVRYTADDAAATLILDMAAAYPPTAHIDRWQRTVTLQRGKAVQIQDDYTLSTQPRIIVLSLVTPCAVDLRMPGIIRFNERSILGERVSGAGQLTYDATIFVPTIETISITDERLGGTWGEALTRVVLQAEQPAAQDCWRFELLSAE
jgi:hypothetical protein